MRSKKRLSTAVSVVLLGIVGVAFLFPFAWMVATSLKPTTEVFTFSPTGSEVAWENYPSALRSIPFGRVVLNSFIVSLSGAALVVVVSVLSAYAFARLRFKGRDHLFMLFLGTLVLPQEVLVIPLYIGMQRMGLVNSYFALIVPFAFGAFGAFLIRQFLLSLPLEFEEAARIDGCSDWQILTKILLPLLKASDHGGRRVRFHRLLVLVPVAPHRGQRFDAGDDPAGACRCSRVSAAPTGARSWRR